MTITQTETSRLVYGCMRLDGDGSAAAEQHAFGLLDRAVDAGIRVFDHADVYGRGRGEQIFGRWLRQHSGIRQHLQVNTKCGVRHAGDPEPGSPARYELSFGHIIDSARQSLERLACDYIDTLILHRYDPLLNGEEIGEAFDELRGRGLVRHFGVSNFSPHQINHVQGYWRERLRLHQMEINICDIQALFDGRLEQCIDFGIVAQAWSPLAGIGHQTGRLGAQKAAQIKRELDRQSKDYGIDSSSVMLAWLMRHPVEIAPVIGTTNIERLERAVQQTRQIIYGREEWYRLFSAIRHRALE